ncbi:MAG: hypothetical protein Q9M17_01850 [Mariprofundus sp.]|nr:hypothetical protein [Mariprofundus sp.]
MDCPKCGKKCFPISRQTILHQVQFPNNQTLEAGGYAFCANPDCTNAYFSTSVRISTSQLRAFQPGQKAMLCHCFDISESDYRAALSDGTGADMKAFVVQQTKEGLCACESRNPSGRCCLANFSKMEKEDDG